MARAREPITLHEAAERLGVHYMTAYRYVRTGKLPAEKAGVHWVVDPADVERMRSTPATRRPRRSVRAEGPAKLAARMVGGDEAGAWGIVENALDLDARPPRGLPRAVGAGARADRDRLGGGSAVHRGRAPRDGGRRTPHRAPRPAVPRRGRKRGVVVVAAPSGEAHALPGAMLSDLVRGAGFEVVDLGADTPAASIVDSAQHATRLVAVFVGATSPGLDESVRASVAALRAAEVQAPVLLGGAAIATRERAESSARMRGAVSTAPPRSRPSSG